MRGDFYVLALSKQLVSETETLSLAGTAEVHKDRVLFRQVLS